MNTITQDVPAKSDLDLARIEAATEYFRKIDNGDPGIGDMFTDDVQIYFPKFGTGRGKEQVGAAAQGLLGSLQSIKHDFDRMTFHVSGDHVIVEGFESGVSADGTVWPKPDKSEGRFCNVFAFEGTLISSVHIYVDPDFTSSHSEGFLWGETIRTVGD